MGDKPLPMEAAARLRSRMAFVAGCLLLVFAAADAARGGPNPGLTLAARLTWAGALFGSAWLLARPGSRWANALVTACFLVSVAALTVISAVAGPHTSSRAFLLVAPLVFAAFVPDAVRALLLGSVATVLAAALSTVLAGGAPADAAMDALRATASGVIAVLGAISARQIRDAELRLAGERARALDALELSERRRVEVERLAVAGSRAAGVAHDMSNPLASMRCNLDWLREAAEAGRLHEDRAEAVQVIGETRECLDRLGATLQEFRIVARSARALAVRADELASVSSPVTPVKTGSGRE